MDRKRKALVREILLSKPFTSLDELIERFPNCSSMTLRRDIEYFESKGEVMKVRGGARAMHFITLTLEDNYYKRSLENPEGKDKIAQAAKPFIETGRSLFFDSGSTVMRLLQHLPEKRLTISTTDPSIAMNLIKNERTIVNLVGGNLNRSNLSISGPQAQKFVMATNMDVAFISPSGFSIDCGCTSGNIDECELKKCVIKRAKKVIALVQSEKFEKSMPHTFATLQEIDVLITDKAPEEKVQKRLKKEGVKLIVADDAYLAKLQEGGAEEAAAAEAEAVLGLEDVPEETT